MFPLLLKFMANSRELTLKIYILFLTLLLETDNPNYLKSKAQINSLNQWLRPLRFTIYSHRKVYGPKVFT